MQRFSYYLVVPLLYLLAWLPFPVFYLFSDLLYVVIYYMVGYRRKVVITNLTRSFPEMTDQERHRIMKRYYKHLCDMTLETFRILSMSASSARKHCTMTAASVDLLERYASRNQNVIIVTSHYGNWEWSGHAFSLNCRHKLFVLYHPLSNPWYDRLMYRIRSRYGTGLIPMQEAYRQMVKNKSLLNATAFIADQTPSSSEGAYWTTFLNQDTAVFRGTELIARKMNCPVIYARTLKTSRGHYQVEMELITETPLQTAEGEITEWHLRLLEADIRKAPEYWLWSHRRWKHQRIG